MSNRNGEDQETQDKENPPCLWCGFEGYIEFEGISLCNMHYQSVSNKENFDRVQIEELKFFRIFFGQNRKFSRLSMEQVIEIRKTTALERLAKQLDFAKDQDGALYIKNNASNFRPL